MFVNLWHNKRVESDSLRRRSRAALGRQMKHKHDHAKQPVSEVANLVLRLMTDPRVLQASDAAIT